MITGDDRMAGPCVVIRRARLYEMPTPKRVSWTAGLTRSKKVALILMCFWYSILTRLTVQLFVLANVLSYFAARDTPGWYDLIASKYSQKIW